MENKTSESKKEELDRPDESSDLAFSTSAVVSVTSPKETASTTSAAIVEEQLIVKRDFPIFTATTAVVSSSGPIQASELVGTKGNVHGGEGDGDDARSTSSSHPFSSPNPSEQDDAHGGADGSLTHLDQRKIQRRRKHNESGGNISGSSIMSGNRPPFPLSERQQMALAMQLSAQNQHGDHPKSPSSSTATTPSTSGGRSRGKLAKVHRKNERGETPLHLAAKRGEFQRCQELIDDGADVNCVDYADWTPLHEACNQGWYKTAKVLVEHGANVNVFGLDDDTPLHDAALSGHRKLVILLLQHGADPFKYNKSGKRPVDVAEDPEVMRLMLEGPPKCSSPLSNYSVNSPANEENDQRERTPQNSNQEKTLTADDIGMDTSSAANTSIFATSEDMDTSTIKDYLNTTNEMVATTTDDSFAEKRFVIAETVDDAPAAIASSSETVTSTVHDTSTGAAYASTESESEQRLVVVEDEPFNSEKQLAIVMEPSELGAISPITPSIPASEPAQPAKTIEETRPIRPKRCIAYMRQRRIEPEFGSTARKSIGNRQPTAGSMRGRKRKSVTTGARAKDVYEFHSSDSDDDADAVESDGKLRKKFAKVGLGLRKPSPIAPVATTPAIVSPGVGETLAQKELAVEAETKAMVEKIKMELERKEEEREKNAVAAVVDAVLIHPTPSSADTNKEANDPVAMEIEESVPTEDISARSSKDDIQLIDSAKQDFSDLQEDLRGRSSSQSAPIFDAVPAEKPSPAAGSRKERLLGFGRRRGGFGDYRNSKEREAHIANVVASIGSGFPTSSDIGSAEVPVPSIEPTHGLKKKFLLELAKNDARQDKTAAASEQQRLRSVETPAANDDEDSMAAGSLKVPPLKLILAGRSNSDEDTNFTVSMTRETAGRTYVVRSRANSPSSERRGSTAGDLLDNSSAAVSTTMSLRGDEFRRMAANNNGNLAGTPTSSNAGNGGGESSQRVTRSQVRLHGAQLDRTADDPTAMTIHPRKRKLRSAKPMIEPVVANRPLVPVVSPSLAAIAVKNSYEGHQHMKKAIASKWKQEMANSVRMSTAAPVRGYEQFLLTKKTYLMERKEPLNPSSEDVTPSPPSRLPPDLAELHRQQTVERRAMQKCHQAERERLIMSCESEAIRDHNRCVRGTADPPMSVMRILRDADLYNPLQLDKEVPFSLAASTGQDFPVAVADVTARFSRPKRQLIGRQRLEAQCLHATQIQQWERKSKALLIQASDTACSAAVNVPQLVVVDDFALLPSFIV